MDNARKVRTEAARQFSKDHGFHYFIETSAKTGFNAQNVFIQAAKELYKSHLEYKDRASRPGSITPTPYQQEINNNILLEDEDDNKPRKKRGCC